MFLQTVAEKDATGAIAEVYAKEKAPLGFVPEAARCLTTRPDLLPLFDVFFDGVRAGFSLDGRDWCLITFVAAKHLHSTYCSQVYSRRLLELEVPKETVVAVQHNHHAAGLSARDVAMLDYAEKIITRAHQISESDIDRLRGHGFTDRQICDIALCASLRAFVSKFVDATGAVPEPAFHNADEAFRKAMTVGRKLSDQESGIRNQKTPGLASDT